MRIRKAAELQGHSGAIYCLAGGREPESFFSASSDGFVAEWKAGLDSPLPFSIKIGIPVYSVFYLKDQHLLFAGNGKGGVHVISTEERQELRLLHHHSGYVFALAASSSHNLLLSGSADGSVSVNRLPAFEHLSSEKLSHRKIRKIIFSEAENLAAIACGDGNVLIFRLSPFEHLITFPAHELSANSIAFINGLLITGGRDAHVNVWKIRTGGVELLRKTPAHNYAVYDIAANPTQQLYATASGDKTIKIWDPSEAKPLARIDHKAGGHRFSVNAIHWISDNLLASAGDDKKIMIWEIG